MSNIIVNTLTVSDVQRTVNNYYTPSYPCLRNKQYISIETKHMSDCSCKISTIEDVKTGLTQPIPFDFDNITVKMWT